MNNEVLYPIIQPVGDGGLEVVFGNNIDPDINVRVHAFNDLLQDEGLKGIIETIPCYCSILIIYDPDELNWDAISRWVFTKLSEPLSKLPVHTSLVEVSVFYGGVDGPDLEDVALYHHLSINDVISLHSSVDYRVYMMGFTPGFPYLGGLNPILSTPRLASPRSRVPAGSVGIAGNQTGIYPVESPGGWRIIGRTQQVLFNPALDPPFMLKPGDIIRFIPMPRNKYVD